MASSFGKLDNLPKLSFLDKMASSFMHFFGPHGARDHKAILFCTFRLSFSAILFCYPFLLSLSLQCRCGAGQVEPRNYTKILSKQNVVRFVVGYICGKTTMSTQIPFYTFGRLLAKQDVSELVKYDWTNKVGSSVTFRFPKFVFGKIKSWEIE